MLKRIFVLCLAIYGIADLITVSRIYAENKFSSLQCDTIIEIQKIGTSQGKFFTKGNKVRMEMNMPGEMGMNTVTIYDGQRAYMYFPAQNMAMTTTLSQVQQQMPSLKDSAELNKKIVGQELIDGRLCDIYEFSDPKGGIYRVWFARDINFPLKSEAAGMKTYYKNIRTNIPLDDNLFRLPSGVQIQDTSNLIQQYQDQTK